MANTREMTCIICPRGCQLTVEYEDKKVLSVKGNACKRGTDYAVAECTCPTRTLTTTVMTESGEVVAVKSNKAIPKELLFDCMACINTTCIPDTVRQGDVVIANVLGTGADIIVTAYIE
ncbi:MAG: DUF1667 domain-containing protein [Clostridia bacterium]|nr:DUF1667 domain-containing protein [Clostridia bacterium]MBR5880189.1 DUF1667 domain-containing protein [Clostridia bacterium]